MKNIPPPPIANILIDNEKMLPSAPSYWLRDTPEGRATAEQDCRKFGDEKDTEYRAAALRAITTNLNRPRDFHFSLYGRDVGDLASRLHWLLAWAEAHCIRVRLVEITYDSSPYAVCRFAPGAAYFISSSDGLPRLPKYQAGWHFSAEGIPEFLGFLMTAEDLNLEFGEYPCVSAAYVRAASIAVYDTERFIAIGQRVAAYIEDKRSTLIPDMLPPCRARAMSADDEHRAWARQVVASVNRHWNRWRDAGGRMFASLGGSR